MDAAAAGRRGSPVSYTHLDVYKRQEQTSGALPRGHADATIHQRGGAVRMEGRREQAESKRPALVEYGRIVGGEITPDDESLERSVDEMIGFLADIDTLDLDGVAPASIYDPTWPKVNEVLS